MMQPAPFPDVSKSASPERRGRSAVSPDATAPSGPAATPACPELHTTADVRPRAPMPVAKVITEPGQQHKVERRQARPSDDAAPVSAPRANQSAEAAAPTLSRSARPVAAAQRA